MDEERQKRRQRAIETIASAVDPVAGMSHPREARPREEATMLEATKSQRLMDLKARFEEGATFTIERIVSEYGVTRRTANRDLNDLAAAHVELATQPGPDGRKLWQAASRSRRFSVTYSLTELMALFLGRRFFDFLSGTLLEEDFDKVLSRVESQLGRAKDRERASKLGRKLYLVHEGPKKLPRRSRDVLDDCLDGLLKEERLAVHYRSSSGKESDYTLCPYTLVAFKRGLYLIAAVDEWDGRIGRFALERIRRAKWLRGQGFEYPKKYDPETFLANALFLETGEPREVEILFTPGTRPFVEFRKYHRTQKLEVLPDGRVRLTMRVPVGDETKYWVLSFGGNAEVVSPPELRKSVAAELSRAAGQYRADT
jgi:predicted DNA-binding transcriptional regulator YafY